MTSMDQTIMLRVLDVADKALSIVEKTHPDQATDINTVPISAGKLSDFKDAYQRNNAAVASIDRYLELNQTIMPGILSVIRRILTETTYDGQESEYEG